MITSAQAQSAVLTYCQSDNEKFVVYFCELSPRQDYWIIRCELETDSDHCYTGGADAYLVDVQTGEIDVVYHFDGGVEGVLQDKYDAELAGDNVFVLTPAFTKDDKHALINLKQRFQCGYPEALRLVSKEHNQWLTGQRRYLQHAQAHLNSINIDTEILLVADAGQAIHVDRTVWFQGDVLNQIMQYIERTK